MFMFAPTSPTVLSLIMVVQEVVDVLIVDLEDVLVTSSGHNVYEGEEVVVNDIFFF